MSSNRATQQTLDPTLRSVESQEFQAALRSKVVGQEEGVRALVDLYQVYCAGMSSSGRPVGNLLFLGPTGSGKTRIVEAAAEILFGDPRAVIKIDCAEFQHSHEIAKLIGSPPGYLEKASDALWQLLLGILDKATLTLGDNRRVDLSQTMIFLTSNLGGGEITELMTGGMGFVQPSDKTEDKLDQKVEKTAQGAAKKKFSPEFMNRLDKVVVFHPLRQEQLEEILEIELGMVQQRVLDTGRGQFLFRATPAARTFLLREGTDFKYGARHLKRAIEKFVVYPLANLLATEQVRFGDMLVVDWDGKSMQLSFHKEGEGAVVPVQTKLARGAAQGARATGGKVVEAPAPVVVREAKAPAALPSGSPPPVAAGRRKVDPQ